jgi:ribonuclease HI
MNIKIFTDGSCTNNGRENSYGSYAYLILVDDQHFHEASEFIVNTSNNKMELTAMLKSLQYIKECCYKYIKNITIYSDSNYAILRAGQFLERVKFTKEKLQEMPNKDLLEEFTHLNFPLKIKFQWVKGHSKETDILTEYNNYVDNLCTQEILRNNGTPFEDSDLFKMYQAKKEKIKAKKIKETFIKKRKVLC